VRVSDKDAQIRLTEERLREFGIEDFTYHAALPISEIDVNGSRSNQVRDNPINPEHVEELAASLRQGDSLPPIIVTKQHARRSRPFFIWSGNHRDEAHRQCMRQTIPAIEVHGAHEDALRALAVVDNVGEGLGYSKSEKLQHAVDMAMNGMSRDNAAKLCHVSPGELSGAIASREGEGRVYRLDVIDAYSGVKKSWATLRDSTRRMFVKIDADLVFVEALKTASTAQLTGKMAKEFISEIQTRASDGTLAQLNFINDMRREWMQRVQQIKQGINPDAPKTNPYSARSAISMTTGHLKIWNERELVAGLLKLPAPVRDDLLQKTKEAVELLTNTVAEVERNLA
jgi:hypothetical protein